MTEFKTLKFRINHFNEENLRNYDIKVLSALSIPLIDYLKIIENDPFSFSGFYQDKFIAVAGVQTLWQGVGEAFLLATPYFEIYPMYSARIIKRILYDKIISSNTFDRIQTSVKADFKKAKDFIHFLGFTPEGIMKNYINK